MNDLSTWLCFLALGQQVQAKVSGVWHTGKVFKVQRKGQCERWRIKFDKNSRDRYDKWYVKDICLVFVLLIRVN